ncbi:MFS transporter [Streptomyces sp. NPDC014676]|uniref:MFS transporter n=1 Tax=Streptomyces sp. NPDC014676 TaxID=3364879 RepID=UPI0036FE79FF
MSIPADSGLHAVATRKAMLRLLPILCLAYFMSYVDRTNIALAKTHLQADVGISAAAFGLGAGLFFLTYALFEVPSNLIMYRIGPRRWIARIALSWGAVTALMMFITNDVTFYIARIALGAAEAGLYPAMMFMMTRWFAQKDRATAVGFVYLAPTLGLLLGGPLGGALMELDSLAGFHGWQWMFLIEGLITIVIGLVVLAFLPEVPADAPWLTVNEAAALTSSAEQGAHPHGEHSLKGNLGQAFGRPFILLIGVIYFLNQVTMNGVTFNVPSIIASLDVSGSFLIGLLSGVTGIGGTIGVLVMPALFRRAPPRVPHHRPPGRLPGLDRGPLPAGLVPRSAHQPHRCHGHDYLRHAARLLVGRDGPNVGGRGGRRAGVHQHGGSDRRIRRALLVRAGRSRLG